MTKIVGYEQPSIEDALAHFGVLGMKWGKTRAKGNARDIRTARRKLENKQNDIFNQHEVIKSTKRGSADRTAAKKKQDEMVKAYNSDPNRVLAARMTRGEKAIAFILAGPFAVIPIATSSATSRAIERKQEKAKGVK
jgi:hypothetical protein